MNEKLVYKNPKAGQPLISTISSKCETPVLQVKFCNLINPYRYKNSPTIPRYSITCVFHPNDQKEFIKGIKAIEQHEKVESVLKNETSKDNNEYQNTGNILVKFQTKEIIPVYHSENPTQQIELQDELAPGERVVVIYDILRYTKKNTMTVEHGLSFKPIAVYIHPEESK